MSAHFAERRTKSSCQTTSPGSSIQPRTLITGAAGFVGSHLASHLVAQGHRVLAVDNLFNGRRERIPKEATFEHLDLGISDEHRIFKLVRDFSPDTVIHLAAIHYIPYCLDHPLETFMSNTRSTEVLVRALGGSKRCRFILASTADVYRSSENSHSEDESLGPQNPYGLSKLLAEEIVEYGARTYDNLRATILRFFNIYGPHDETPHVIPRIIDLIRSPLPGEIKLGYLDGSRDFVHVSDVIEAISLSAEDERMGCEVFNVGTGISTPVRQVVRMIQELAGDDRPVFETPSLFRSFDRQFLTANISNISYRLGWEPRVALREGLAGLLVDEDLSWPANEVSPRQMRRL